MYLNAGKLYARAGIDTLSVDVSNQQWHHVVQTYGAHVGGHKLYLDGRLAASSGASASPTTETANANIGGGPSSGILPPDRFVGLVDDVRLFSRGLTAAEVAGLFNQPVFYMNFEKTNGWADVSAFHSGVAIVSGYEPAHVTGIQGMGARFNGRSFLNVAPSPQLDLSGGKFSLAVWVYPEKTCGFASLVSQFLVASDNPDVYKRYLSLANHYDPASPLGSIAASFGTGSDFQDAETGDVLPSNKWTHLVVTFDKEDPTKWRLYMDGKAAFFYDVAQAAGNAPPYPTTNFQVGLAPAMQVSASGIDQRSFCGVMDELMIYNRVLDAETVADLTRDQSSSLHLPFDEAPGAGAFHDLSAANRQVPCGDQGCPVSGVWGRRNEAASFDGAKGQTLALANSTINQATNNLSVAAWLRPAQVTGRHRIIATAATNSVNGWGFGLDGQGLVFTAYTVKDYLPPVSALGTANFQPGKWVHVAAVMDGSNDVHFYVNGELKATVNGDLSAKADVDDQLMIGAGGSPVTPAEAFSGLIDDLWVYGKALTDEQVRDLYRSAPELHLPFEEAYGSVSFQANSRYDTSGSCTGQACPLTGEGVRGQLGLAAEFDGVDDLVSVPVSASTASTLTLGAWIWPAPIPSGGMPRYREVVAKRLVRDSDYQVFGLDIDNSLQPAVALTCSGSTHILKSTKPLMADHWNHVMATFDGNLLRLYQNGYQAGELAVSPASPCNYAGELRVGGGGEFAGRVDEVTLYDYPLSAGDIRDLYNYQAGWVEDRVSQDIVVDGQPPSASVVIADHVYLANWPVLVALDAHDANSEIQRVEFGVAKAGGTHAWTDAARCETDGPAWCATFTPAGAGAYDLYARATDSVGWIGTSAGKRVFVDDQAPVVKSTQAEGALLGAIRSTGSPPAWLIHLTGTVQDPAISGNTPGSGVPADGVRVTLRDADGKALGSQRQAATLSGAAGCGSTCTWNLEYRIEDAAPDGCYTAEIEAIDNLARDPGLPADQVAAHTSKISLGIEIDASAPVARLDREPVSGGQLNDRIDKIHGNTTERPVPVEVIMTTSGGADQTSVKLTCQHGVSGSWYTLFDTAAGSLSAGQVVPWESEIHQWELCHIDMTTTAASSGVAGVVKVCGVELTLDPPWTGNFTGSQTISFVVISDGCVARGCSAAVRAAGSDAGGLPVAGVQKVEAAFTSILPGSPWANETPPAGEIMHLPLDDTPDTVGVLSVRDVSGGGHKANSCDTSSGSTCPSAGQAGHERDAYHFDGVDDYLAIPDSDALDFAANHDFAVMAWIKPDASQGWTHTTDNDVIEKWSGSGGYPFVIRYINQTANPVDVGKIAAARWDGQSGPSVWSTSRIDDGRFHHVAFVKSGGTLTLYVDGVAEGTQSDTTTGATANTSPLYIGRRGGAYNQNYFAGTVDDVRIFNRGLSAGEVKAIYTGSGPQLLMTFEAPLAKDGDRAADSSSWGRDGTLHSGTGDTANKAAVGQVGDYSLSLDGANDNVTIGSFGSFTTTTVSAWVYRTGPTSVTGRETIVSYKEAAGCGFVLALEGQAPTFYANGNNAWYQTNPAPMVPVNQWVHIAAVLDGSKLLLYENGQLSRSNAWPVTGAGMNNTCTGVTAIGSRNSLDTDWFPGRIDEVRIYGRPLSANEIVDLYHAGWQTAALAAAGETGSYTVTVPSGLEGSYRVDLRAADNAGHIAAVQDRAALWSGVIDNMAPRVTLCKALGTGAIYRFVAVAQDYHLVETNFTSPCPISSRTYFLSPWLLSGLQEGQQQLNQVRADCQSNSTETPKATACDSAGNCATVGVTAGGVCTAILAAANVPAAEAPTAKAAPGPEIARNPTIAFATTVLTRTHYLAGGMVGMTGYVTGLRQVSGVEVTVDGVAGAATVSDPAPIAPYTITWSYSWPAPRADPPDGLNVKASAAVTAPGMPDAMWQGSAAAPAGLDHRLYLPLVFKAGQVQVSYSVEETLIIDVAPPWETGLALTADGQPVQAGTVIRLARPELRLAWEPAADGSGTASYTVRWTGTSAVTRTETVRSIPVGGPYEDRFTASEAERVMVELVSRDQYGNERSQGFGPVLVDSPLTPDFVLLPPAGEHDAALYSAWLDSGCTLLGTDGRAARVSSAWRWPEQKFNATWDGVGVRLAWRGANWSTDGDLFIYLDSVTGSGTETTFTPYPVPVYASAVLQPPAMSADLLIWVRDATRASLLRWDGAAWTEAAVLSSDEYRFDPAAGGGETDLYLPAKLLGLDPAGGLPNGLGLVAFATEEPEPASGLRIWATLPVANPVNSSRSNVRAGLADLLASRGYSLPLLHEYRRDSPGAVGCPNGSDLADSTNKDTQVGGSATSDPPGATVAGLADSLYWVDSPAQAAAAAVARAEAARAETAAAAPSGSVIGELVFDLLNPEHPPVKNGQEIVYTIHMRNNGSHALPGAWLALEDYGSLRMLEDRFDLGDIAPGEERTAIFHGVADLSQASGGIAIALAQLYSTSHGPELPPLEWLAIVHRVDQGAPRQFGLRLQQALVGAGAGTLHGFAIDESGVKQIVAEVKSEAGNTSTFTCPAEAARAGGWHCQWDATAANGGTPPPDGAAFSVRVQAVDSYDQVSDWSDPLTVRVDAAPPDVTLATTLDAVQRGALRLSGVAVDASGVEQLSICVDERCRDANVLPGAPDIGGGGGRWRFQAIDVGASDFATHTVTIAATDPLGNRTGAPQTLQLVLDNVTPSLTATQLANQVALGSTATVLRGVTTDGGPSVQTFVMVETPAGDLVQHDVLGPADDWTFDLAGERPGRYLLTVEAQDLVGNKSTVGPFTVDVTCTEAALAVTSVTAEPVEGSDLSFNLRVVLANGGPLDLPAGIPVGFYDLDGRLAALQTTAALANGGAETLAVPWSATEPGRYEIFVAPDDHELGLPAPVVFCTTPATERAFIYAGVEPEEGPKVYLPLITSDAMVAGAEAP